MVTAMVGIRTSRKITSLLANGPSASAIKFMPRKPVVAMPIKPTMVTTGFLGMNLIAEADGPFARKLIIFLVILIPTIAVTVYTVLKSRRLSEFLDKVADERALVRDKFSAFLDVWRTNHDR